VSPAPRVIDLEREKTRRLAREIERELRNSGDRVFAVEAGAVEDVSRWRRAAIMAAHRMGHQASTYLWRGEWRVVLDVPVTAAERRRSALLIESIIAPPLPRARTDRSAWRSRAQR
jgi:hypothetical protein